MWHAHPARDFTGETPVPLVQTASPLFNQYHRQAIICLSMRILETDRLVLRWLAVEDAEFIFDLLNQPSFLQFIGNKGVRTIDDARNYILTGDRKSTRLNSSHSQISYAVFCLKKKTH